MSTSRVHHHYRPRQILIDEGCPVEAVYCIRSGFAKLYKLAQSEEEVILGLIGPGSLIGYLPVLDHRPHPASVETLTEVEACTIDVDTFENLTERNAEVMALLHDALARDLRAAQREIVARTHQSVRSRVARLLVWLDTSASDGTGPSKLILHRWEIAQMIGSSAESVSRQLHALERDGLVSLEPDRIRLKNADRLLALAHAAE